jgi:hypothetical protein
MHRVYNSAFMIMLRDEGNAQYRLVVKNTLEFDPEILKRYVNFMNNPDERTALDQFGKGDKYFGICTLMATMPGLPMFGHGQVEGFSERYGMEYRRAYYDESPDAELVARHERQIAPLLHRRELFAQSHDFRLYDFFTDEGWVNEDVFAYSNRGGGERALVVYHNRYARTAGWLRTSCAYAQKTDSGGPAAGPADARRGAGPLARRDDVRRLSRRRQWSRVSPPLTHARGQGTLPRARRVFLSRVPRLARSGRRRCAALERPGRAARRGRRPEHRRGDAHAAA